VSSTGSYRPLVLDRRAPFPKVGGVRKLTRLRHLELP
jgi:hypothetical protein